MARPYSHCLLVLLAFTTASCSKLTNSRESERERENCTINRVAVVANANHATDLSWLRLSFTVEEVGFDSSREIGESKPWLHWIVDNYDTLPQLVIFLHGQPSSWHHAQMMDVDYLCDIRTENITMLSDKNCVWAESLAKTISTEIWALNVLYQAFWGMSFEEAFSQFHMANTYICCAENVASKTAIQRYSKEVYMQLVKLIDDHPTLPWGWIYERIWQNLFSSPSQRTYKQINESLAAGFAQSSFTATDISASIQRILKMAASCER